MATKILLVVFLGIIFTGCSTAYKSSQTPDDVYFSPAKFVAEKYDSNQHSTTAYSATDEARLRMQISNKRWRSLEEQYDYDYSYNYSPYYFSYNSYSHYDYYYNPYYCARPLYNLKVNNSLPINTTPRMVNLNAYKNYNFVSSSNLKNRSGKNGVATTPQYNNSNSSSKVGNLIRQVFSTNNRNAPINNTNNNARTYNPTPSTNSNSSTPATPAPSSSGSSSGSVSRPSRGG